MPENYYSISVNKHGNQGSERLLAGRCSRKEGAEPICKFLPESVLEKPMPGHLTSLRARCLCIRREMDLELRINFEALAKNTPNFLEYYRKLRDFSDGRDYRLSYALL